MPVNSLGFITRKNRRGQEMQFRTGHLIVKFDKVDYLSPQGTAPMLDSIIGVNSYEVVGKPIGAWAYFKVRVPDNDLLQIIYTLDDHNDTKYAEPDLAMAPCSIPLDPMLKVGHPNEQWGPRFMKMGPAWDIQEGTEDVVIALLDTGVPLPEDRPNVALGLHENLKTHLMHEDLDGKRFIAGWDYVNDVRWPRDDYSSAHGTKMAGIMAAKENNHTGTNGDTEPVEYIGTAGINWASFVFAYKAVHYSWPEDATESEYLSTEALVHLGVRDAAEYVKTFDPVKKLVINLSLQVSSEPVDTETLTEIFNLIKGIGAIACIAVAGAEGVAEPAKFGATTALYSEHVIAVGATQQNDQTPWVHGFGDMVYAPGHEIWSTDKSNAYDKISGTSPATAHVSGLAALMWSEAPHLEAKDIVRALKDGCRDPRDDALLSYDYKIGHGIVDAHQAFQQLKTRLCLVLDKSGSMEADSGIAGQTRLQILKTAANDLVRLVDSGATLGIASFNHGAQMEVPLTLIEIPEPVDGSTVQNPRTTLKDAIDALNPSGQTSIGAGINVAGAAIRNPDLDPPKAIIVLTDGRENHAPFLADIANWPGDIKVFAIGMGTAENLQPDPLITFTENTGGYMIMADELENAGNNTVSKYLAQIVAEISDYSPVVDPAMSITPGDTENLTFPLGKWDWGGEIILIQPLGAPLEVRIFSPIMEDPWEDTRTWKSDNGQLIRHRILLPPEKISDEFHHRGEWRVEVSLPQDQFLSWAENFEAEMPDGLDQNEIPFTLMINTRSSLKMQCRIKQTGYKPGATMTLAVELTNGGIPLEERPNLKVLVTDPSGNQQNLKPETHNSGEYACSITAPDPGIYHWLIQATGPSGSKGCFQRECRLTGAVWHPKPIFNPKTIILPHSQAATLSGKGRVMFYRPPFTV